MARRPLNLYVKVYNNDVHIKRDTAAPQNVPQPGIRQAITGFSLASQRRLLHVCRNSGHLINSQISLTYHNNFPNDGLTVKGHVNTLLTLLRKNYPDLHYIWAFEFQDRGAPHVHLFTDRKACSWKDHKIGKCSSDCDVDFHKLVAESWARIINEADNEKVLKVHLNKKNFISWDMRSGRYLTKVYMAKISQKLVPEGFLNVGRFWGASRNMTPEFEIIERAAHLDDSAFEKAIRTITKKWEKNLRKPKFNKATGRLYKGFKRKYRAGIQSYVIPNSTKLFLELLHFKQHPDLLFDKLYPF